MNPFLQPFRRRPMVLGYVGTVAIVGAATLLAWVVYHVLGGATQNDQSNVVMVFMLGVVSIAIWHGRGPAILASVLSVAIFDFLFVPPFFTFAVRNPRYIITFGVMLVIAIVISELAERLRTQAEVARRRENRTAALLRLSRKLGASVDVLELIQIVLGEVAEVFDAQGIVMKPATPAVVQTALQFQKTHTDHFVFDEQENELACRVYVEGKNIVQNHYCDVYLPLMGSQGTLGVLGVKSSRESDFADPEQLRLLEAFALQAAAAMERAELTNQARSAWEQVEKEFLRNTLLSSVSHDLRTPLAAIIGTADTLLHADDQLDLTTRKDLTQTLLDESRRMERTIANLLDMTRLEAGGLRLKREWHPLSELVGSALRRMQSRLGDRPVEVHLASDLPMIYVDAIAFEQVLVNLLDNAAEYTPAASLLRLSATMKERWIVLDISDCGPGIPAGKENQIFEKFFRSHPEGGRRGIGLGLSICRGIVESHGGRICAFNRAQVGATFRIELHHLSQPQMPPPGNDLASAVPASHNANEI